MLFCGTDALLRRSAYVCALQGARSIISRVHSWYHKSYRMVHKRWVRARRMKPWRFIH